MKKVLLALACAAASLAPLAAAHATVKTLATSSVGSPVYLSVGDIGTASATGDTSGISTLSGVLGSTGTGTADYYFAFNSPTNQATSYLGNFSFTGDVSSTITPVGSSSDLTAATAGSYGQVVTTSFAVSTGKEYELVVTGAPGASFAANISTAVSAAPEPATWALMMVAIGGIGMAMRRSRRAAHGMFSAA